MPNLRVHHALPLLLLAALGCGGGSDVTAPPSPLARVLSILAGQGSSGPAGTALTTRPSVRVADAAGAIVAGATVTFAVDAGGGTIANSEVVSDAAGVATAGAWTLGATAGPQALRVSTANAAPVVISATATPVVAPPPPPPPAALTYSAWRISSSAGTAVDMSIPADTSRPVLTRARQADAAIRAFWSTAATGVRIPTLWYVAANANIGGSTRVPGLYVSDSLPGSGPSGADPTLYLYATPNTSGVTPVDDPAIGPMWTIMGTPPTAGQLLARFPTSGAVGYIPNHPATIYTCILEFNIPFVYYTIDFTMSGSTGSGRITYFFRDFTPSCRRPNVVNGTWNTTFAFTATRVR